MNTTIQDEINELINAGSTKREIYEKLKLNSKDKDQLAKKIQNKIYPMDKIKYKRLNNTLIIILTIIGILDLASGWYSMLFVDFAYVYAAFKFNVEYYSWIALRGFLGIIIGIPMLLNNNYTTLELIFGILILILIIASFLIGISLVSKLTPSLKTKIVTYIDENGINKYKNIYDFN